MDINFIFTFTEKLFTGIIDVYNFLINPITVGDWHFVPIYGIFGISGVLFVAWFVKKLVPIF